MRRVRTPQLLSATLLVALGGFACSGSGGGSPTGPTAAACRFGAQCGPWPDQATSPWVLPLPVGTSSVVMQGNCTTNSHNCDSLGKYAYDLELPIGTPLVAVRDGVVRAIEERFANDTGVPGEENFVFLDHADGTQSRYFHLDTGGVLVDPGAVVAQGQEIARSGNSGGTPRPHLHLEVIRVGPPAEPVPLTFRNTRPHPNGLQTGETYTALGG